MSQTLYHENLYTRNFNITDDQLLLPLTPAVLPHLLNKVTVKKERLKIIK